MPTAAGAITSIWVCSNGWISFESTASTALSENVGQLLSETVRVAPYWDDLNPAAGGAMYVETIGSVVHVTWEAVPEFAATNQNTLQISFDTLTGNIECNYGPMAAIDGLVGYSPGHGAPNPGGVDITGLPGGSLILGSGRPAMSLSPGMRPVLGMTASCTLNDIPGNATAGAFLIGGVAFNPGLPLDVLGMTGCELYTDARLISIGFTPAGSTETLTLPVGGNNAGVHLFLQGAVIAPGVNPFGVTLSNGLDWLLDVN
jgi:hypothetical protein